MGRSLKSAVSLSWLANAIGCEHNGVESIIDRVDSASAATSSSLCFVKNAVWAQKMGCAGIVMGARIELADRKGACIFSENPRLDFARLMTVIDRSIGFVWSSRAPSIHPTARIGKNVVIGPGAEIGAYSVLGHNIVIGAEVVIGERCNIKSGAILGEEGFGFERNAIGAAVRLPHIGTVIIGDDVEIGSLTTVCRGTLENTIIANGVKIDDHVHVAHNIFIGEHSFIIACAEISGGVKIGSRAWIAPAAAIRNQLTIGDDAVIGLGAIVVKSVESGQTVAGNPAQPLMKLKSV